jgi:flagellum-specific peptidoglycan hydrolase FlgJ
MPGSGNKGDRSDGGSGGFGGGGNVAGGRGGEGGGTKANFKGGDTVSAVGGNWARIGNFIGNPELGPSTSATGLTREQALGLVGTPRGKMSGLNTAMAMGMYGGLPAAPAPAAPARPAPVSVAPIAPPIAAPPPAPTPQLAPPPAVAPPASLVSQAFNTSPSLSSPNLAPPNPGTFGIMSSSQVPGAPAPASPAMASMAPASMSTKSPAPADSHTPASISPARRDTTMSSGIAALGAGYMGKPVGAPQGGLVGPSKDQSRIGPAPAKDQSRIGGMPGVSSHSMNMGMADFARPGDPGVAGVPGGVQGRGIVGGFSRDRAPDTPGLPGSAGDIGVAGVPGGVQGRGTTANRGVPGPRSDPRDAGVMGISGGLVGRGTTVGQQTANAFAGSKMGLSDPAFAASVQKAAVQKGISAALNSPNFTKTQNDFLSKISPDVFSVAQKYGLDPRMVAAQAALESAWGTRAPNNNLFGVKAGKSWAGATSKQKTKEQVGDRLVSTTASFRAYPSFKESLQDYGALLGTSRYANVRNSSDLASALAALGRSGYATDRNYAGKVGGIANRMGR